MGFESLPGSWTLPGPGDASAAVAAVTGGPLALARHLAIRLVLLAVTLVLVPSASFVMFTLLQGDVTAPLDVLRELGRYLAATFLQREVGSDTFQSATFRRTRDAFAVVRDGFAIDCGLLVAGLSLGVLGGLLAGSFQATRPRAPASRALSVLIAIVLSSPVYWIGLMMLLLFAPGTGDLVRIPFLSAVDSYRTPGDDLGAFVQSLWVPCLILAAPLAAACARMSAGQLRGALGEDFVRTARGKGVAERRVVARHALPPAAAPVIALAAVNMNLMLTNLALIESVFNIPGAFRYIERALVNRDVDLVQALIVESTLFIVVANLLGDVVQAWLDPRVRRGRRLR